LENIRVLCFGVGVVVPDCTKALAEFGADVIKIESSEFPDVMRTTGKNINAASTFNEINRNKRSLGVNLRTEKGRDIVRDLIKTSDIVAENFRGGVMESFGLDYESVRQIKPDIIYISSQGFGGGGPYSEYEAFGPTNAALCGILSLWAHPEDPYPVGAAWAFPDHVASKHAAIAALAALDHRRRTGEGQFIDMAQTEVAAGLVGEAYLEYAINHRVPGPMGNNSLYAAPHGCYPCRGEDRWCVITVFTDQEWQDFCETIGNPPWSREPRFADIQGRLAHVGDLNRLVGEWTATRDAYKVVELMQRAGIAAGVVQSVSDVMQDPQLKWDGAILELDHPVVGKRLYQGIPYRLSGIGPLESRPAPLLGQHTDEICREVLKISEEELKQDGILDSPSI